MLDEDTDTLGPRAGTCLCFPLTGDYAVHLSTFTRSVSRSVAGDRLFSDPVDIAWHSLGLQLQEEDVLQVQHARDARAMKGTVQFQSARSGSRLDLLSAPSRRSSAIVHEFRICEKGFRTISSCLCLPAFGLMGLADRQGGCRVEAHGATHAALLVKMPCSSQAFTSEMLDERRSSPDVDRVHASDMVRERVIDTRMRRMSQETECHAKAIRATVAFLLPAI